MGLMAKIFGGGSARARQANYENLESFLRGKITPSADENEVRAQLNSTLQELPKNKKRAFQAYIKGSSWKKMFVKK